MSIEELANEYYKWKLENYGNPQYINHNSTIKDFKAGYEKANSQFKNTDAVKVITDRIEKLENNLAFRTHGWLGNKLKYQLQEAKDILKLIQP